MTKECIYYTDNQLKEPLFSEVQKQIEKSELPIVSTSLKTIDFGKNIVVEGERGYITMVRQILTALENSEADYVFFCEHDVLYHSSHFYFTPPRDDIFYYNENCWRWWIYGDTVFRHDRMLSLSCLCCNRKLALANYRLRMAKIEEKGLDKFMSREPEQARIWGYEPGIKKKKRGGVTDDDFETWNSEYPNIDVRHKGTFSSPKFSLKHFSHSPKWWKEINLNQIKGWNHEELLRIKSAYSKSQ